MKYDKQKVADWIKEYWSGPRECNVCQHDDWMLMDNIWELREFTGGSLHIGGPVLPVIGMMCNVCGHIKFFSAVAVRAMKRTSA